MSRAAKQAKERLISAPTPADPGRPLLAIFREGRQFWIRMTAAAVLLRLVLLLGPLLPGKPPPFFAGQLYPGDHDDFVRWGIQSTDRGVLTLYTEPPPRHDLRVWGGRDWGLTQRKFDRVCNYPPLSAYLLWFSGIAFKAVSHDRVINTPTSLGLFTFWSVLGDFLVAAGCAAIVAMYRRPLAARLTYALVLLLPPLWWDSLVWGQMDTVLLAPAVWMLWAMLRDRWVLAGVLWGLMFGLKPQAILFIPVWGYALLSVRPFWRPILGGIVATAVLGIAALPFMLTSGFAWFKLSYWENLFSTYSHLVTLKAFNIWYLSVLLTESLDANVTVLGATKGQWGKIFLLSGLLVCLGLVLWRWGRDRRGLILFTALCLLCFVFLPTEVHERYLVLVLPFLGILAGLSRRVWPGLLLLLVVMMAQLSWPLWLRTNPGQWPEVRENAATDWHRARDAGRPVPPLEAYLDYCREQFMLRRATTTSYEWLYTILGLMGAALSVAMVLTLRPTGIPSPAPPPAPARVRP